MDKAALLQFLGHRRGTRMSQSLTPEKRDERKQATRQRRQNKRTELNKARQDAVC